MKFLKYQLPILFLFFCHSGYAQKRFEIQYWKIMILDKKIKPVNGQGYYLNEPERFGGGEIIINKNEFSIKTERHHGDPEIKKKIIRTETQVDKTIYYGENCELIVFAGRIEKLKKLHQIQYNKDYDETMKLYSKRVVFETATEFSAEENKIVSLEKEKEKQIKIEKERTRIKDLMAEGYIFNQKDLDICPIFIGSRDSLIKYYINHDLDRFTKKITIYNDGTIDCEGKKIKMLLKFIPGKRIIGADTFLVNSRLELIFMERGKEEISSSNFQLVVKKRNKAPLAKIISSSPQTDINIINKAIDLEIVLKDKPNGTYKFIIYDEKVNADIYLYTPLYCKESSIAKEVVIKKTIKYKFEGNYSSAWEFVYNGIE